MKIGSVVTVVAAISLASMSGVARAQDAPAAGGTDAPAAQAPARGLFEEPAPLRKGIEFGAKRMGSDEEPTQPPKNGFYPEFGNMVTGAGWISAGVGYRRSFMGDHALFDASTGLSWRAYKMAQARLEFTPLDDDRVAFGTQLRWQDLTQVNYFGEGPDALETDRSEYRLKSLDTVGYTVVRPRQWLSVFGRLGWLSSPNLLQPAGAFSRGNPSTIEVFPGDRVFQLAEQPDFLHGEAAVVIETRDEPGYPTSGGVYRAAASRYSDRDAGRFSFGRYEAEAAHFVPFGVNRNVVLAVRGWLVGSTTGEGQAVPFYLMPSLGGSNTLRGHTDLRFHDRNLVVVNTELRVAIFEHLDAVGLFDAGNVAARFGDLNFDKRSYGVGVRVHTRTATVARFDVAHGSDGWKFFFRMNDPLRLSSRHNKRTAQVPFTP
jgi:hypothetical protein